MKQEILEEVKEHTDWVNSYVIVEKVTGNHHSPNHTVKKILRICLDTRDLNEALERKPYHTCSAEGITAKSQNKDNIPTSMEMCMDDHLALTPVKIQQKQFHGISPNSQENTALRHTEFPPDTESMPFFSREPVPARKEEIHISGNRKHATLPREPVPARKVEIHIGDQTEAIRGYK